MHTYANALKTRVENGDVTVIDSFDGEFRWLSNFYYHDKGVSVEHLFQASKPHRSAVYTTGEGEDAFTVNWMELIMQADTPGKAKRLGRKAPLRKDWDKVKLTVMYNALVDKYNVRMLGDWLVATGDVLLVEGNNWHDNYWGDCRCNREGCVPLGHNHLGMLLMRIRDELRESAYLSTTEEIRLQNDCMKRESSLCDCPLCSNDELTFTKEGDALMEKLFVDKPHQTCGFYRCDADTEGNRPYCDEHTHAMCKCGQVMSDEERENAGICTTCYWKAIDGAQMAHDQKEDE